ncbi:MAG: alcohol dehydrogenase, partial [Limisphaerales bacterium]
MRPLGRIVLTTACLCIASPAFADDWPHWRGPQRSGISQETGWMFQWPEDGPKIAWKANVGLGYSGIVAAGGRAVTAGHNDAAALA